MDKLIRQVKDADSSQDLNEVLEDGVVVYREAETMSDDPLAFPPTSTRAAIDVRSVETVPTMTLVCNDCGLRFAEEDMADDKYYWHCRSCGSFEVDEAPEVVEVVPPPPSLPRPWSCPYCQTRFHDGEIDEARPWCPSCRGFGVTRDPGAG